MDVSFKEQCIRLRRKDFTLPEIVEATGRPKTSVYFHIKNFPLSTRRLQIYKKERGEHIRTFALARKGKSTRSFTRFDTWSPDRVLLIAHLLFDGEISRGKCAYSNRSRALIERVERLMRDIYTFIPKRRFNLVTGVMRTVYFNVELGAYLQAKSAKLISEIRTLPVGLKKEFLRAFFDDEGCMDFRPKRNLRQIRGYQKNVSMLHIINALLLDFDIQSSIKMPNEVVIKGKENLLKFRKEINFSPGVRINGNRSNSLWKAHLEKRELLERAIKSFRS